MSIPRTKQKQWKYQSSQEQIATSKNFDVAVGLADYDPDVEEVAAVVPLLGTTVFFELYGEVIRLCVAILVV